jgi:hypothetical protein
MPYEIRTSAFYEDVISWLQENIGDLQWSRPIVEWKGRGWSMNAYGVVGAKYGLNRMFYIIRVDDAKLATLTTLRWSS